MSHLTEDQKVEVLLVFGNLMLGNCGGPVAYWTEVHAYLHKRYPNLPLDGDYPTSGIDDSGMTVLMEVWEWMRDERNALIN